MPESDRPESDLYPAGEDASPSKGTTSRVPTPAPEVSPLDREEFLAANRTNRAKFRTEAEKKAARRARRAGADPAAAADDDPVGDPVPDAPAPADADVTADRLPGRVAPEKRRRSPALLTLAALVAVLAVAVGVLGYLYAAAGDDSTAVDGELGRSAIDDAKRFAVEMVTYESSDYDDLDRRIREISTGEFADVYIGASAEARRATAEVQSRAFNGVAESAGLISLSEDAAEVLVALDYDTSSPEVTQIIDYQARVQISLVREGDRWLLGGFDIV